MVVAYYASCGVYFDGVDYIYGLPGSESGVRKADEDRGATEGGPGDTPTVEDEPLA